MYHERESQFFIEILLVRIHLVIEMTSVERPCAMGVFPRTQYRDACFGDILPVRSLSFFPGCNGVTRVLAVDPLTVDPLGATHVLAHLHTSLVSAT